jgi:hypothetical protein
MIPEQDFNGPCLKMSETAMQFQQPLGSGFFKQTLVENF